MENLEREGERGGEKRGVACLREVGGKGGRCSLLMFLFYFSKVCTEKQFQEKVLTRPGNKLFARKPRSMVVPSFFPTSSSLFLLFLPSYLSALGLHIPTFVLSSFLLSCPLSIQLHPATPPNTFFTKQCFLLEKLGAFYSEVQNSHGKVWSHAVKDNHHTYICNPITHKPIWSVCCPI